MQHPSLYSSAAHLKEFNWATERDIRHTDIAVFKAAASVYEHIILVRATNPDSLPFIGKTNYSPKPIDCKPKTASNNALFQGKALPCAGLVVDPTLLPNAFNNEKQHKARRCWEKFTQRYTPEDKQKRIFRRKNTAGFYIVDTDENSSHYGCLMISTINPPNLSTDRSSDEWKNFAATLSYLHGDYDLYGLIDIARTPSATKIASKKVHTEVLHGEINYHSPHFHTIKEFLNNGIGAPMIQHGSQDTFGHDDDKLYAFTPTGQTYVLEAKKEIIREVYRHVFKERPISNGL